MICFFFVHVPAILYINHVVSENLSVLLVNGIMELYLCGNLFLMKEKKCITWAYYYEVLHAMLVNIGLSESCEKLNLNFFLFICNCREDSLMIFSCWRMIIVFHHNNNAQILTRNCDKPWENNASFPYIEHVFDSSVYLAGQAAYTLLTPQRIQELHLCIRQLNLKILPERLG